MSKLVLSVSDQTNDEFGTYNRGQATIRVNWDLLEFPENVEWPSGLSYDILIVASMTTVHNHVHGEHF